MGAAGVARGAHPAALAGERQQQLVAAVPAAHPREASGEDSALEVVDEVSLDEARLPAVFGRLRQEGGQALAHRLVRHRRLGVAPPVAGDQRGTGHLVGDHAPCTTCHASHGASSTLCNRVNNAHLSDFDVSIVRPKPGVLPCETHGNRAGSCTLTCHGHGHTTTPY